MTIPEDLVEDEIICRVPARHLKQLRSTCRRWNRSFKHDSRFATNHSNKAAKELLVLMLTKDSRVCPVSVNLDGIVPSVEVKSNLSLIDPLSHSSGAQFDISYVFHCDGLLLCVSDDLSSRLVVWNPCTGETKWIKPCDNQVPSYFLGYYQDTKSSSKTYKILSSPCFTESSKIYEFSSDSWRVLDHSIIPTGWHSGFSSSEHLVSLKGKTYWLADGESDTHPGVYLLCFDFSSEMASVLVQLPYQFSTYKTLSLSVVREAKLSVLLQRDRTSKTEIWVTNQIDESKPVSWSRVLALDLSLGLQISSFGSFLLDEDKKVAVCCERWYDLTDVQMDKIYVVGEDKKVTQECLGRASMDSSGPAILNYVPSLAQVEPAQDNKRRRGD